MKAIQVTKENFEREVQDSDKPVIADFWAVWCGYCTMLSPTLDELAQEYGEKFKLVKINVDEQPELTEKFDVEVFPTLILLRNGEEVDRAVGAVPKLQLQSWLKQNGIS